MHSRLQSVMRTSGWGNVALAYFRALSSNFPDAIHYRDKDGTRQVLAVLDLRRSTE